MNAAHRGWRPWAGLVAGPLAWALHHQAGSYLNFTDCRVGDGATLIGIGLVALGLTLVAALVSYGAWRSTGDQDSEASTGRFIAALSLMTGALAGLTILIQIGATVALPPCFR